MIPEWLQRSEDYQPRSDRDAFVDRNIRSLLAVLSRVRLRGPETSPRPRVNACIWMGSTILLILLLSLSRDLLFVGFAGALLLAVLSAHRGDLILRVLRTSILIGGFTFLVMAPSALWGNLRSPVVITLKVLVSAAAMNLFVATEEWDSILGALRLFLPRLLVLVLDITTRYLSLLGELSLHSLTALRLRSVGRNAAKTASLGGIAGTLFLRSRRMAEDLHAAMECRCFTGSYPVGRVARVSTVDLVPIALDGVIIIVFIAVRSA